MCGPCLKVCESRTKKGLFLRPDGGRKDWRLCLELCVWLCVVPVGGGGGGGGGGTWVNEKGE